jgi:site-specific DNA-methyltransferase (adenine-specific)
MFTASHETLIWAKKSKTSNHTFNYDIMKNSEEFDSDILKNPGKQMRSVWAIGSPKKWEKRFGKHPTQKPEELLKRIILSSSNESDVVLDPFVGSGTTGVVSVRYKRNFIGIDFEKEYLNN